ncbi:MAG: RcnB family protein [Sphingomonadales bacterium]|nr:RcnB family protein [Sphingomonadales bacterium]MBD3774547.1 RcnB family protein [Paracoccaceae bacterium]
MKRFVITAAAATLALGMTSVATANPQPDNHGKAVSEVAHSKSKVHKWSKGEKFSRAKAPNYSRVDYRRYRKLSAPPRGYVWVRSGEDALLVRLSDNVIRSVVGSVF